MDRDVVVPAGDGVPLLVHLSGEPSAPPVLQLSGGPGYAAYLADTSWSDPAFVVTPEARGVGGSGGGPHDVAQALADIEAVRRHLRIGTWAVVGHSWGADLGLAYALTSPELVDVLVHACGTGLQNDRGWSAVFHERIAGEPEEPIPYVYESDVHAMLLASWREWITRSWLWRDVAACPVPVLVVVAGDDLRPSWPNEQLALALPRARLLVVDGVGHNIWAHPGTAWRDAVQRPALTGRAELSGPGSPPPRRPRRPPPGQGSGRPA